ncbi:MAG TPA: hypothetical protein VMH26_12320 [Burkholderiales bacterium]|nr:hypothetical protein [Burkholderiales bacterium]
MNTGCIDGVGCIGYLRSALLTAIASWLAAGHPAFAQDQHGATLPDAWKGQLIYETRSTSSMSNANIVLTIDGTIPFTMDGGHLAGNGTLNYLNQITAGGCDTKVTATVEVTLDGAYDLGAVARLIQVADDAGSPDGGSAGTGLKINSTSKMSGFDGTVNCRGKTTKIPSMPQMSKPQTSRIKLPLKDGAKGTQQFNAAGFTAVSTVTLNPPCPWNYHDPAQPPILTLDNDPRKGPLYPQTPDPNNDEDWIKGRAKSGSGNKDIDIKAVDNKYYEGLTIAHLPGTADVATDSQPSKFSPGKTCRWDKSVRIEFKLMEVYVARHLDYNGCHWKIVLAHEKKHQDDNQRLLIQYANELEREFERWELPSKPHALEQPSAENFEQQQLTIIEAKLQALNQRYKAQFDQATAKLDDPAGDEMRSVDAEWKKCGH